MKDKYHSDQILLDEIENDSGIQEDNPNGIMKDMKFICADITQKLEFPNSSFDLIIDKGLLDSLLCSSVADCRLAMNECSRLLNDEHGAMIIVSRKKPDDRLQFIKNPGWTGGIWHYRIPPTEQVDAMGNTFKE